MSKTDDITEALHRVFGPQQDGRMGVAVVDEQRGFVYWTCGGYKNPNLAELNRAAALIGCEPERLEIEPSFPGAVRFIARLK